MVSLISQMIGELDVKWKEPWEEVRIKGREKVVWISLEMAEDLAEGLPDFIETLRKYKCETVTIKGVEESIVLSLEEAEELISVLPKFIEAINEIYGE